MGGMVTSVSDKVVRGSIRTKSSRTCMVRCLLQLTDCKIADANISIERSIAYSPYLRES